MPAGRDILRLMKHILFTGFPGFLGSQLLFRLLTRHLGAPAAG